MHGHLNVKVLVLRSTPALCWGSKLFSGASTGQGGRLILSRWHSWQTDERKFNEALVHEQTTSALIAHNKILPAGALASITPPKRQRLRYFYSVGGMQPLHVNYPRAEWVWKSLWSTWSKPSLDAVFSLRKEGLGLNNDECLNVNDDYAQVWFIPFI